jgi:peptidoglycan hydrolase-like protein with peptidoglycan-binding domain
MIESHENMVKLQTELQARGLYSGEIDGKLGRGTRSAILSFENSLGLLPTGLPTLALLRRFGQERIRPAHMYSNASGPMEQTEAAQQEPEPRTIVIPTPPRRPKLPKQRSFDPFGLLR